MARAEAIKIQCEKINRNCDYKTQIVVLYIEYNLKNIYTCFDGFGVLESNGIHPRILSNKNTMFSRYCEDRWWIGDWVCGNGCRIKESDAIY